MQLRVPPHNLEAEQSVIGGLMLEPLKWDEIADTIAAEHFYKGAHRQIFECIQELQNKGEAVDIITVSDCLKRKDLLETVGGASYLADLLNNTPTTANIAKYADLVVEKSVLRRLIHECNHIVNDAYDANYDDVGAFLDSAEGRVFSVAEKKKVDGLSGVSEILKISLTKLEDLYNNGSQVIGIPSGFTDLDKLTAGFQPGELTILAARPSMGKTALSLNIATNAALKAKKCVAYFSLEMNKESLMFRVLGSEARVNLSDVRTGKIPDSSWPKLINTASALSECNLFIDDTSGISPFEIRAKCRRLKAQMGLDMIMIDYLQLMDLKQKVESRERAVSEISKTLKAIAKELEVPVIALSQLNRGVESRSDRRPMLSDLRESGSIEQDADIIMMIYRDEYYEKENSDDRGLAEIIVGKQRNGPTGTVKLAFLAQYGLFANLAPHSLQQMEPKKEKNLGPLPPEDLQAPPSGPLPNYAPKGNG